MLLSCFFVLFFSFTGQLNYEIALGVYAYLGNETEYVPWAAAVNNIGYLEGMFKRKAGYGALKVCKVAAYKYMKVSKFSVLYFT